MIKEKTFYKSFMVLALSLALQNLLTYGVNLMDTMMLGRYSQDAMGGVSLCNQVQFLLQMLVVGAGEGAVVMGSQYWGKNKLEPIPHIIGVALRFGGSLAVLMFGIVLFFPHQLLSLLSNSPTVIAEGEKYFQIICFTYIIFTITNILVASLRSIGVVKIGYMISGSTLIINVCLNYCLIYGHFGCPELGVRGAAIATLVSRCVELLIVIYYLKFKEHKLNLSLRNVSVSTCGLADQIRRLAEENLGITLSLSLHAPNDEIRRQIMPVARRWPLGEVMAAVREYVKKTGHRVVFEYALIDQLNSRPEHAVELAALLRDLQCHVNLIPLNHVDERALRPASPEAVQRFLHTLESRHISATVRREMGSDIGGACGQLRRRELEGKSKE